MTNKTLREGADSVVSVTSRTAAENESQSRHSPLPWKLQCGVCPQDHPHTAADVIDAEGEFVANCGCTCWAIPNTERIIRACNSHDDLLAALKAYRGGACGCVLGNDFIKCGLCVQADGAILKAEGR